MQGRADERNERIDMVTRGMLGLTVACARCHDHKYDPISQKDYYSLAAVFLNTTYHEYPAVSRRNGGLGEAAEGHRRQGRGARDFMEQQSDLYSEMLAQKTSKYLVAAWQVTGEPKKKVAEAAVDQKVDPEMLERWIKFLAKPPKHYSYLRDWQDMVKCGGTLEQAQFLADYFQNLVLARWPGKRPRSRKRTTSSKPRREFARNRAGILIPTSSKRTISSAQAATWS